MPKKVKVRIANLIELLESMKSNEVVDVTVSVADKDNLYLETDKGNCYCWSKEKEERK